MDTELIMLILPQLLVILLLGALLGKATERLGMGILSGAILAGLLLGPMVFGQATPTAFQKVFHGGITQQQQIERIETDAQVAIKKLEQLQITEIAIVEYQQQADNQIQNLRETQNQVRHEYTLVRRLAFLGCGVWLLMSVGFKSRQTTFGHVISDGLPLLLLTVVSVIGFGLLAGYLLVINDILDWPFAFGMIALSLVCALPIENGLLERLHHHNDEHAHSLEDLSAIVSSAALLIGLLAWVILVVLSGIQSLPKIETTPVTLIVLQAVSVPVVMLLIISPLARWLFRSLNFRDHQWVVRLIIAISLLTLFHSFSMNTDETSVNQTLILSRLLPLLYSLLIVAMGIGMITIPKRKYDPQKNSNQLWLATVVVGVYAGFCVDFSLGFSWWVLLAVLLLSGDAKALGTMLGLRWFANRNWREVFQAGFVIAAGGPIVLILAVVLQGSPVMNMTVYNALVIAVMLTSGVGSLGVRLLDKQEDVL